MNGFFATLLSLMMTGIAVNQQPQSSQNPLVPDNKPSVALLGKYLLVIDDSLVDSLIAQGYLSSPINLDVRSSIDHIVFHNSDRNSLRTDIEPVSIQPLSPAAGSLTLQFLLTDEDLRAMRERGLRYIIPANDRGRFSEVAVLYDPPNRSTETRPFNGNQVDIANQGQVVNRQEPFIGPQLPDNWVYRNPSSLQLQTSEDSFRARLGSVATRQNSFDTARNQTADVDPQAQGNPNAQRYSTTDIAPRLDRGNGFVAPTEWAVDPRNRQDVDLRVAQQREWELARENDELKQKLRDIDAFQARAKRAPRFASAANAPFRDEYEYPYSPDARPPIGNPTGSFPNRYADEPVIVNSLNQTAVNQLPPDRIAATPRPTNKLLPFAVAVTDANDSTSPTVNSMPQTIDQKILADNELTQRQNRALWFIMLCSVGLNFYLSWISRGFYVRYEELAEEIRESFTATS